MPTDLIRYDLLVQDALRSVVRNVLADGARDGLPGEHHFCITFRTQAPGVRLSPRVREKHPDELTIILQHQFWDLIVTDQAFEVGLSFNGVPERLAVPFEAVTGFWDPYVQFGLKFEVQDFSPETSANDATPAALPGKPAPVAVSDEPKEFPDAPGDRPRELEPAGRKPDGVGKSRTHKQPTSTDKALTEKAIDDPAPHAADKVVSIDAFRKKT